MPRIASSSGTSRQSPFFVSASRTNRFGRLTRVHSSPNTSPARMAVSRASSQPDREAGGNLLGHFFVFSHVYLKAAS
jgi:hypothetical protein